MGQSTRNLAPAEGKPVGMEIQPCAPHPEPEASPQLVGCRAPRGRQDSPVTCRIAVQLSSRRAHLAAANILLPSGIVPCKSLVGSPNPSGTGAAAFTWDRQPTLLQPEPGPSQEMAPRAVPPSPPQQRSLLQPPSRVQGPQGASPGGSQPYRCWRWWGAPRGAALLCGDHRESAATIMDQRPHALCWPRAAAVTRTEQGPVGLQGLCARLCFLPPACIPARPMLWRQITCHRSAAPLYLP